MPIITITHKHDWDMGHRLPRHDGKCARLHGHRYVAEIDITGELQTEGPATGMVIDFYLIKEMVKQLIDVQWDHRTMLWEGDPLCAIWAEDKPVTEDGVCAGDVADVHFGIFRVPFMPTAENIAAEILKRLRSGDVGQGGRGLNVTRVRVYETPNGWAEARA
jgi:6-pyruvoyltetrahydropterin/6-carboxytetrahydropterin synthase